MDRRTTFPIFAKAPAQYDPRFFDTLSTSISLLMTLLRSPGEGRQTTMVFTNLPSNDYGLEYGSVFEVDGAVRISKLDSSYPAGVSSTCSVGTVSVVIS